MSPQKIYLKDYTPPAYELLQTTLSFEIYSDFCRVTQTTQFRRLDCTARTSTDLYLDGEDLTLESLKLNQKSLEAHEYKLSAEGLTLLTVPQEFTLEVVTRVEPDKNTSLEGLYSSDKVDGVGRLLCTQCEAQGFRRITYFMDRPDVMTTYTVHIEADQKKFPILLSNGNKIESQVLSQGRHRVTWQDPFKKPCYLFALVAGDLGVLKDQFVTQSGQQISLEIYSAHGTQERCTHAMNSLKKSMTWDEQRFGREYDLSAYMIVATDDFNAGAMENKGLNVFNSRLVFADSKTATDGDYFNIESVIAHEYFHNWTGNRITLRDWFHLSLKEGLTVFRDQEFSMDMASREMVRIDTVADLRSGQFAEDSGPNAHPIRPDSCYAVDNFFTSTIYEKGAEVIRMMQTMVGRPGFRKGMDLYFSQFDGKAVIIEDFAHAIATSNQQNWDQFQLWYSQAGTPTVKVSESFSAQAKKYTLTLEQSCAPTPGQETKEPFHIPLVIGLIDASGNEISLQHPQVQTNTEGFQVLHLKQKSETYVFSHIDSKPQLSLNRQFSAPIHLNFERQRKDEIFMLNHDTDSFNRWESAQKIQIQEFHSLLGSPTHTVDPELLQALKKISRQPSLPEDFRAALLQLPDDSYLSQLIDTLDGPALGRARQSFETQLAQALETELVEVYQSLHGLRVESTEPRDFAQRKFKNTALALLAQLPQHLPRLQSQFDQAQIMTDELVAFSLLTEQAKPVREAAIDRFYQRWQSETLVLNKWFSMQALSQSTDTFTTVVKLLGHPKFNLKNPNNVYSLLLRFGENFVRFHDPQNETYSFMADQILLLDKINPQVATRVAGCFNPWRKLLPTQQQKAQRELERLVRSSLSKNTYEVVSKQLV